MHFTTICLYVCVSVYKNVWHAIVCVYLCVGVCNEQRIQVQRQKHTPECSGGILAQTGHQMSEQCRNLLSGPVTLFFLKSRAENRIWASRNKLSEGLNWTRPHTPIGPNMLSTQSEQRTIFKQITTVKKIKKYNERDTDIHCCQQTAWRVL